MVINNPRWPHTCTIKRVVGFDPFGENQPSEIVIYEGACRNYSRNVTKGGGEVITSARILSIPMLLDEWKEQPEAGDQIVVHVGNRMEHGEVVDYLQTNFGTEIGWRYVRN